MIISHKHKYLFVEVPSTGSTAISAELTSHYGGEAMLHKHANYTECRKIMGSDVREYFVFSTVRNPLDFIVTDYFRLKGNHKNQYTTPSKFERNGGFVTDQQILEFEYIRKHDVDFARYFHQFQKSIYHNWFLVGHANFDYIMRYERLAQEFESVLKKIGLETVRQLPKVNKTALKNQRFEEVYTPDTFEGAYEYYGPFMHQWGYEFPKSWPSGKVPWRSNSKFRLKERLVNTAAHFITLSPSSPVVQRVKAITDIFT